MDPFAGRYFDRELWHRFHEDDDPDNPRASMVTDLQWNYLKKGMTRSDVEELLGTPDFEKRDDVYSYNLGMWSGHRMDYDSLDIHFDADGKLADVRRLQH
ncbi:MAG: outer membrane protein assembly factor BamE [Pirellula sp.]|jgi:outer membrane protein assembly factor BamE (lipoprotein component of BamABCDE complex)|nr:outer membrane protein assembly factor BamE [Pirellula sp.]